MGQGRHTLRSISDPVYTPSPRSNPPPCEKNGVSSASSSKAKPNRKRIERPGNAPGGCEHRAIAVEQNLKTELKRMWLFPNFIRDYLKNNNFRGGTFINIDLCSCDQNYGNLHVNGRLLFALGPPLYTITNEKPSCSAQQCSL